MTATVNTIDGKISNVVVLGGSYSGARAAELLSDKLPAEGYRVILVDRQSHFNHLYKFVRYSVVPGHAQKGFVPYTNLLQAPLLSEDSCANPRGAAFKNVVIQASVLNITGSHVEVDTDLCEIDGVTQPDDVEDLALSRLTLDHKPKARACCMGRDGESCSSNDNALANNVRKSCAGTRIPYAYLIYALGSHLPQPIASTATTKPDGINFLKAQQDTIRKSERILIIGGGALGIQYAADIKESYPQKHVTLLHSRPRLLPLFDAQLHDEVIKRFDELGIETILGDRAILPPKTDQSITGLTTIHTEGGRSLTSDLRIFSTGQKPNSALVKKLSPASINEQGYVITKRTMQIDHSGRSNVFAVGDVIEGFGAIKAGHTGWNQAGIAVENVIKLIKRKENRAEEATSEPLSEYTATPPMLRLTLGLKRTVSQLVNRENPAKVDVSVQDDTTDDGDWQHVWKTMKAPIDNVQQ